MINSRSISDLNPSMQAKCTQFVTKCKEAGINIIITSTFRDKESQAALYAQGRTTSGAIVTNAPAGSSFHNYRVAFDFAPVVGGKIPWNDVALFTKCGEIGESLGLEWAGRWKTFKEMAHLQEAGHTIADLRAAATQLKRKVV